MCCHFLFEHFKVGTALISQVSVSQRLGGTVNKRIFQLFHFLLCYNKMAIIKVSQGWWGGGGDANLNIIWYLKTCEMKTLCLRKFPRTPLQLPLEIKWALPNLRIWVTTVKAILNQDLLLSHLSAFLSVKLYMVQIFNVLKQRPSTYNTCLGRDIVIMRYSTNKMKYFTDCYICGLWS